MLSEILPNVDFLFLDSPVFDEKSWAKAMKPGIGSGMLTAAIATYSDESLDWEAEALKGALEQAGAAQGLKLGKAPVQVAVTGRTVGAAAFRIAGVAGQGAHAGADQRLTAKASHEAVNRTGMISSGDGSQGTTMGCVRRC
ncbi:hypothetical protein HNR07_000752 [Nocardiopsis metallicus]|uniref:Aminoacyl-tRNA synthetase class I anticodon-binding domain-containing protein n=1 Tax=Nocardiopsis metallicus TaxID=179819 RepID=A0A840WC64_9ACTN|nr:hypothetical protein [Nocardiopsis metallicus]